MTVFRCSLSFPPCLTTIRREVAENETHINEFKNKKLQGVFQPTGSVGRRKSTAPGDPVTGAVLILFFGPHWQASQRRGAHRKAFYIPTGTRHASTQSVVRTLALLPLRQWTSQALGGSSFAFSDFSASLHKWATTSARSAWQRGFGSN